MHRRELLLLVGVVAALSLTVGTTGVSSVSADRSIEIAVVDDQAAFLTFEQDPGNTTNGTTSLDVTVGNQYPAGTTLSHVRVSVDDETAARAEPRRLDAGARGTWTFSSVSCNGTISVEAEGAGVATSFERPVACQ